MVNWEYSDPENDSCWVTVYLSNTRELNDELELIEPSLHTSADLDFVVLNTAEVKPGTYYLYCQITDGGQTAGDWSEGTLTIVDLGEACIDIAGAVDCNGNGLADACDIEFGESEDCNGNGIPDECDISSGNSGGSALDPRFRLIGVPTYVVPEADGNAQVGFIHTLAMLPDSWLNRIESRR